MVVANGHRFLNGSSLEMILPFIMRPKIEISTQWYYLFLGEQISYSFLWLLVIFVVQPVMHHLEDSNWAGLNPYLVFSKLWYKIFILCFIASVTDTLHFLIFFKRSQAWFLIQTGSFSLLSAYFIFKSYIKKWKILKKM